MPDNGNPILGRREFGALSASAVATTIAGCIGGGSEDNATLSVWSGLGTDEWIEWSEWYTSEIESSLDAIDEATYTSYSYEDLRDNVLTGGTSGEPDVIEGRPGDLVEYQQSGIIASISEDEIDHIDGFDQAALDAVTIDGELYGLPYDGNSRALVYRADVLDEYGFDEPETWEEFLEAARAVSEGEDDMWGTHYTTESGSGRGFQEWLSHYFQFEDDLFVSTGDGLEVQPDAETLGRVYELYNQLFEGDPPAMNPDERGTDSTVHDEGYANGDYAMIAVGPWIQTFLEGEVDEGTQVTTLPEPEDGGPGTLLEIKPIMVNAHSSNLEMATQAAGIWASEEGAEQIMSIVGEQESAMVHQNLEPDYGEVFDVFTETYENGSSLTSVPWGIITQPITDRMEQVIYDEISPQEAGENLHEDLADIAEDFN